MKRMISWTVVLTCVILTGCTASKTVSETSTESVSEAPVPTTKETSEVPPTIEPFPETAEDPRVEPPVVEDGECRLMIASDIHYLAKDLTDFSDGFKYKVEHGDGKALNYVWEITDAFIAAIKEKKPELVILSGDLTLEGEKKSHVELAAKLNEVELAGIPVIVIPGNHDINNTSASGFVGAEAVPAEFISPDEFVDIYQDFGYEEAVSRDPSSLSYVYQIDEYNRALMLDTCQYESHNQVGGMIQDETYDWIEEQMEDAWGLGMNVIPVGHHNLLTESEVYVGDCTIEHSEQLIAQLESWEVPLFLSGHLHVQHFLRSSEDSGIYEIVTSSLTTPPCQYGILTFKDDASFKYHTEILDMEAWAKNQGSEDKNLLHFKKYGQEFVSRVFYNQAQDEFARLDNFKNLETRQKDLMAKVYAELNSACYAGKVVEIKDQVVKKQGYRLWEEHGYPSILNQYLESIVRDGTKNYNSLELN